MNQPPVSDSTKLKRIRALTWLFILGLVLSGATAIQLEAEVNWLVQWTGAKELVAAPGSTNAPAWANWLVRIQSALHDAATQHPMLFYGTDWLAFGHFVIAIAFIGALRDPVRNRWLFDFALMACVLVIPYAMLFGAARGIPFWWRLIDSSFGVIGFVPVWCCRKWARELEGSGEWASNYGRTQTSP